MVFIEQEGVELYRVRFLRCGSLFLFRCGKVLQVPHTSILNPDGGDG